LQAPGSAQMKQLPEIRNEAPGFDRAAFHGKPNAEATAFFRQHLGPQPKP
jgi:hypothetical protein